MSCSGSRATRAFLTWVRATSGLDVPQAQSVFHLARAKAEVPKRRPSAKTWQRMVDERIEALALDDSIDPRAFSHLYRYLRLAREDPPPDPKTYAALRDLPMRAEKATAALRRQVHAAAAFRGVTQEVAEERFEAFRQQYLRDFRGLPSAERPDPPKQWLHGYRKRDMLAVSSPQDRATLFAMYRCQADPGAFPASSEIRYVSTDLETAGPAGREGFDPPNGSIIEVGIVEYDGAGRETGRYSQLIHPGEEVAARCGTGAEHIHGISMADVADAPSWATVAPEVADRLNGRVLLAQNARFEAGWLHHHLTEQGRAFDKYGPTVDTMAIARQHTALPSATLQAICGEVGVPYTNGHRAEHDADVTARAFFRLKERIHREWGASAARAAAPHPAPGEGLRARGRKRRQLQRLAAGDFDPVTVDDPWAVLDDSARVPSEAWGVGSASAVPLPRHGGPVSSAIA